MNFRSPDKIEECDRLLSRELYSKSLNFLFTAEDAEGAEEERSKLGKEFSVRQSRMSRMSVCHSLMIDQNCILGAGFLAHPQKFHQT
ncbi:MAG: hypothetical protein ACBR11_11480 [Microcoleus sp.]|uniref:hypothetical protein n=1 Tax=Microcoleus sp. TaxID=44472 RepID=UPI0035261A5A